MLLSSQPIALSAGFFRSHSFNSYLMLLLLLMLLLMIMAMLIIFLVLYCDVLLCLIAVFLSSQPIASGYVCGTLKSSRLAQLIDVVIVVVVIIVDANGNADDFFGVVI